MAIAIVLAGSVVQTGLGMGFGITAAPILALVDPALVPTAVLYLGTATSLAAAVNERSSIIWREVSIGLVGRVLGSFAGLYLLVGLASLATFSLVFGAVILFAVGLSVVGWKLALTPRNLLSMGVVSGFTGIITSVGAPPLALIYQHQPALKTRSTLASYFALGGVFSLVVLHVSGLADWSDIACALFLAPAAIAGTWLGRRYRTGFDGRYRIFLLSIAAFASLLLIYRGVA